MRESRIGFDFFSTLLNVNYWTVPTVRLLDSEGREIDRSDIYV